MNRVLLSAQIIERKALRYTPAGLPALDLILKNECEVTEAQSPRKVTLEIRSVAIGPIAMQLNKMEIGSPIGVAGFLGMSRAGRGVLLHITELNESI